MTPQQKQWIDKATYAELIDKIRTEPVNSEWFADDTCGYLMAALRERVERLVSQEAVTFPYLNSSSASGVEQIYVKRAA